MSRDELIDIFEQRFRDGQMVNRFVVWRSDFWGQVWEHHKRGTGWDGLGRRGCKCQGGCD